MRSDMFKSRNDYHTMRVVYADLRGWIWYQFILTALCTSINLTLPPICKLSLPDSLDSLGDANIVCLELIKADSHRQSRTIKEPVEGLSRLGHSPRWEVVDYAGLEAQV
jgi:hypothetical protein